MVDPERLRSVLRKVSADIEELRGYADVPAAELIGARERLGNVKYLFVTAIEGCIDAAQHVCASERWGPPSGNADAMRVLAANDIIAADLAESMARAVGFRNILVHEYRMVDERRVVEYLSRLGDLEAYVTALGELV